MIFMCYSIPGKVVGLDSDMAVVDYFGERRNVLNDFPGLNIGDYVLAQGGVIIDRIPEDEAAEVLALWQKNLAA